MKQIFALGTVILSGALLAAACTVTDSDSDPDTTENSGGAGGNGGSGGSGGSGGTADGNVVNTATSGAQGGSSGNGGSGGTYSSGGSGGSGGTYASGGDSGSGGWAGDSTEETTTTSASTSATSTTGGGGTGGTADECLGDDEVEHLPDCADLEYAEVVCDEFDPPEPFGMTHCKQFSEHGTPEAFKALFDCLNMIDEDDACGEAHDEAVRLCRDGNLGDDDETNDGVIPLTCPSEVASEKCANLGCPEIDTSADAECDVYLSAFTPAGVDHVIACANDNTGDEPGGPWGAGPDTMGCGEVFFDCVVGLLQPTH